MIQLRLFALLVGFGASIGLWRFCLAYPPEKRLKGALAGLLILAGGLVGARAGYVLAHDAYFATHPDLIIRFWQGGLNAFGLIMGMVVFALLAAAITRDHTLAVLDRAGRMAAPLGTAIWLGLWGEGVAYGALAAPGTPWGVMTPDESGALAARFPLQFAAALSLLILCLLAEGALRKSKPGFLAAILLLLLSAHTLVVSILRVDPARPLIQLRMDVTLALMLLIVSALFTLFLLFYWRKKAIKSGTESAEAPSPQEIEAEPEPGSSQ